MPPKRYITWPFIKQVLEGKKKLLKQSHIRINIIPPKIRDLTVKKIWNYLKNDLDLLAYFPDQCLELEPPREFFFSIVSSIRPDIFQQMLQQAEVNFWNKVSSKNEVIAIDHQILDELNSIALKQSLYGRKVDKRISLKARITDIFHED